MDAKVKRETSSEQSSHTSIFYTVKECVERCDCHLYVMPCCNAVCMASIDLYDMVSVC